jgi:putative ATPase
MKNSPLLSIREATISFAKKTLFENLHLNLFPRDRICLIGKNGVGKTTLARLLAEASDAPFYTLSAIASGVKEVREVIDLASKQGGLLRKPVLFIDEIHRFSKSQQDSLLGAVERGIITLIGATTENPSFEVIPALLSRCQVYVLKSLEKEELIGMIERSMKDDRYLKFREIELQETHHRPKLEQRFYSCPRLEDV